MCKIEYEVMEMGRPKGGKNRKWTATEKEAIVRRYLESGIGRRKFAAAENLSDRLLHEWVRRYHEHGKAGLENKRHTGNPYAALATSKSLPETERLRLTVAKQKVEIARLKNGYQVRGGDASKVFVTLNGANIKSSKN